MDTSISVNEDFASCVGNTCFTFSSIVCSHFPFILGLLAVYVIVVSSRFILEWLGRQSQQGSNNIK